MFKINSDASIYGDCVGFDCIIRNSDGVWQGGCIGVLPLGMVLRCELFAIWRGLLLAWEAGYKQVSCETDCLKAFLLIQDRFTNIQSADHDLVSKIHDFLTWNWRADVKVIQRLANHVADAMAKFATVNNISQTGLLESWDELRILLTRDLAAGF
nr:uncharacterized protein LOC112795212 [Arachis hypogaea]